MVLVAILSVCTGGAWSYIPQMRCQAYFNDVHAKTYSHAMTAPPPQCTAFTSYIYNRCINYLINCSYTGTQVCNDPERKVITILLTNRCYKNDTKESKLKIAETRRMFNSAVKNVVDSF